ncbi:MAG: hypothetical protein RL238_1022, partial [Actinomycetota bacterium]
MRDSCTTVRRTARIPAVVSEGTVQSARDALVTTAIEHLAKFGPVGVQPQEICAELGISKALVNYHFGG